MDFDEISLDLVEILSNLVDLCRIGAVLHEFDGNLNREEQWSGG